MKIHFFAVFLFLTPILLTAQFEETFSDGDFTNNPTWQGNVEKFAVNTDGVLQLQATDAGTAYLSVEAATADSAVWEFWVRLDFAPSTTNLATVYLTANVPNLTAALNGYFVKIGGISGSGDAVELYRQSGLSTTRLISGTVGGVGNEPALARIRVVRRAGGNWELLTDYTGGNTFLSEGTAVDNTHPMGSYFGVVCTYTTTRSRHFFFDDIFIAPLFVDTRPPEVVSVQARSASEVEVVFSEALSENSATRVENYKLNGNFSVRTVTLSNPTTVLLSIAPNLISQQNYTLSLSSIADAAGNVATDTTVNFTYLAIENAEPYDLLISEIMAAPSPPIGLPNAEYIELYNRSKKIINLENFILADARDDIMLPFYILFPDEYVVLHAAGAGDFSVFGKSMPLPNFLSLANAGEEIQLLSPEGLVIHAVDYSDRWYKNSSKASGGWSLELINLENPCSVNEANWIASENANGGTPAQANSVSTRQADVRAPQVLRAFPLSDNSVRLFFDEAVDRTAAADLTNFEVEGFSLLESFAESPLFNTVRLTFDAQLEMEKIYTIQIRQTLSDCVGNTLERSQNARFALPEVAGAGDVILNEILFNPESGGSDFVELYNRSEKTINIGDLFLATRNESMQLDGVEPITADFLLFPNDYVVLTENPIYILSRYKVEQPSHLFESDLPTYGDKAGTVVLYRPGVPNAVILDEFSYRENFHFELLDDKNGVSLERINPEAATQSRSNWQSAAASVGFATPTYRNSQFFQPQQVAQNDFFLVEKTTFSPDNDGYEDFLTVSYQFDGGSYIATARIFDANGRPIQTLMENELLPQGGSIKWDGVTEDGSKARLGIYIIWIEYFSPSGKSGTFQETVVVAGRLD